MLKSFPVFYSRLSGQYLLDTVRNNYEMPDITDCTLIACQMNDTYVVNSPEKKFILRVYRANEKTLNEIRSELAIITHLNKKGVPVSYPIEKKDGSIVLNLNAPEGIRYAALFNFIEGHSPADFSRIDYYHFGEALAKIHISADECTDCRFNTVLDLDYLIEKPLEKLECYLSERKADWQYLKELSVKLEDQVENVPAEKIDFGFCHGDSQFENTIIGEDGTINYFDFDMCGSGYRAYDLATFYWAIIINSPLYQHPFFGSLIRYKVDRFWWKRYLTGYMNTKKIEPENLSLIPVFTAVRHIWTLGLRAKNVEMWGLKWIDDDIITGSISFLKMFEKLYLNSKHRIVQHAHLLIY